MTRLIITALITLLASPAFAADVPKSEKTKSPETGDVNQGIKTPQEIIAAANKAYYDKAAAEEGTIKTGSGLLYKSIKDGSGAAPGIFSTVKVNYRATITTGKEYRNTYSRKKAENHKLNKVTRCWQEGLQKMKVGGKAKLVCPPELSFKDRGIGNLVPPNGIVIYEIELLEVKN